MLPTYRDAEGSYYRETEGEGSASPDRERFFWTLSWRRVPCCKEIYYRASALDPKIGVATVYRMVNTLESIGAISRKNMYRVACSTKGVCTVELDDDTICHLSGQKLNEVILAGLRACGEISEQNIRTLALLPVHEVG